MPVCIRKKYMYIHICIYVYIYRYTFERLPPSLPRRQTYRKISFSLTLNTCNELACNETFQSTRTVDLQDVRTLNMIYLRDKLSVQIIISFREKKSQKAKIT